MSQRPVAIGLLLCEQLLVRLASLEFPAAGPHRVTLLADGELIAQRKLVIVPKEASHE